MSTPWPTSIAIRSSRLQLNENKAIVESLFTRRRQITTLSAGTSDRWEGFVETVPLTGSTLLAMWAFVNQVGRFGEFTLGDPDYTGPISGIASALVQGGGQTGTALVCDGVTPSVTVLRAGEYLQVGNGFHVATADCSSDGSGVFTVSFKPAMRAAPADNALVTLNAPVMLLRMSIPASRETDSEKRGVFTIAFEESL